MRLSIFSDPCSTQPCPFSSETVGTPQALMRPGRRSGLESHFKQRTVAGIINAPGSKKESSIIRVDFLRIQTVEALAPPRLVAAGAWYAQPRTRKPLNIPPNSKSPPVPNEAVRLLKGFSLQYWSNLKSFSTRPRPDYS